MKNISSKQKDDFESVVSEIDETKYDFIRFHLGTNSISLALLFFVAVVISFKLDVLNWNYLKGIDDDLSFFIGLFSTIMGVGFYNFWKLGKKSVYALHLSKTKFMPEGVNIIFNSKNFSFGISKKLKMNENIFEFPSVAREVLCIAIFLNLALITIGNGEFDDLKKFPSEILESKSGYCPSKEEAENAPPKAGCELIIRAFKLGYAKDLGICEPKKIDPENLEVCQKRRHDEPYLHYMSRLMLSSYADKVAFFENNKAKEIEDKFRLQLKELEVLKDYQRYAISAAPRASHHIWTNLPYPENKFVEQYRKYFKPSYCIEQFQNQTNTVRLKKDDKRKDSKMLQHVYGQLLFNPKSKDTVGFCKEYKIHWDSASNTCEKFAKNPSSVLQDTNVLDEVELVLKRHDIANAILSLDEKIKEIESKSAVDKTKKSNSPAKGYKSGKKAKSKIIKGKIAKDKQQIRRKNELVSFQCFMQADKPGYRNKKRTVRLNDTKFIVRTRHFPVIESKGDSQISMYKEFSKILENRFHYSQLTSRSDIKIEIGVDSVPGDIKILEDPSYLFTRLERLKNVDIFLGNKWVLERDDLLDVYPYHVHLKNYVKSFRSEYSKSRGRL